jgi:hypothetical protein
MLVRSLAIGPDGKRARGTEGVCVGLRGLRRGVLPSHGTYSRAYSILSTNGLSECRRPCPSSSGFVMH